MGTSTGVVGLADKEWQAPVWGNFETNVKFLRDCRLLESPVTLLEIGCGRGMLLNRLHDEGHAVYGIDVDQEPVSYCQQTYPGLDVRVASGARIPFPDATFDIVVSFDVFEHILRSDEHLAEVRRVLKPGGHYLLQTPNKWTNIPFELLRYWRKFGMGPIRGYRALLQEHCALHNYWQLRRRFAQHDFAVRFFDVPVVNDYFRAKMKTYFGFAAAPLLALFNPDRLPRYLQTNFFLQADRDGAVAPPAVPGTKAS